MVLCYNNSMNNGETERRVANTQEQPEEVLGVSEVVENQAFGRERAGVIGSAALSGNFEQETRRELSNERVEEMVAAENKLGEEVREEMAQPQVEALVMPQIQGKIDKVAVRSLEQLASRDGNYPGRLEAQVNNLRRKYLEGWRAGR